MVIALQSVREIKFQKHECLGTIKVSICTYHKEQYKQKQLVQCMKVEEVSDEEDPRDLHFEEKEGYRTLEGATMNSSALEYNKPLKTKKYNIGSEENPKLDII